MGFGTGTFGRKKFGERKKPKTPEDWVVRTAKRIVAECIGKDTPEEVVDRVADIIRQEQKQEKES